MVIKYIFQKKEKSRIAAGSSASNNICTKKFTHYDNPSVEPIAKLVN